MKTKGEINRRTKRGQGAFGAKIDKVSPRYGAGVKRQLIEEIESLKDEKGLILAGKPHYNRFFGRDSLIVAWQLLEVDPGNCKKTLEVLSEFQGKKIDEEKDEEPGKILHETDFKRRRHPRGYFPFPYYGSVDSTPLYLILFYFYFQKTKDIEFIKKYWKNIMAAINWMEKYGDFDGDLFLEYQRKKSSGLFHQGWKDGFEDYYEIQPPVAIVEAQGYQYLALKSVAFLSQVIGENNDLEEKFLERAERLKKEFNEKFWIENKNFFAFALDGQKKQKETITSNPGHLLFTGIVGKEKEKLVAERLFQEDLWTPFGIRTHSTLEPDFNYWAYHRGTVWPHDNWIISQGLKKLGYEKEYQKIKDATLKAYYTFGFIPECFVVIGKEAILYPRACFLQAWASGALLNFLVS